MSERCGEFVHNPFGVDFHQCSNKAKVERGGKNYCGIHDPEGKAAQARKKRSDEAVARYRRFNPTRSEVSALEAKIERLEATVARLRERGLVLFDALSNLSVAVHDWNDGTLTAQQLVDINTTARKALNGSALSEERDG